MDYIPLHLIICFNYKYIQWFSANILLITAIVANYAEDMLFLIRDGI